MQPFETYLRELREIRSSGAAVQETSYYGPLATLLNEVGKTLSPRVRCVINLKNHGAGIPDGGLFTADQLQRTGGAEFQLGQLPSRGVLEIKGTRDAVLAIAQSAQVAKYLAYYGLVLVTNYRDFLLVGRTPAGVLVQLEGYQLADSEAAFWNTPLSELLKIHGERFIGYLHRVLMHAAPLSAPKDVAWMLASYARDAKSRLEQSQLPALNSVRVALEEALGITFDDKKGDQFFRSTLVQTLFYGVFSAWVLWSKQLPVGDTTSTFDWRIAAWSLRVPMIRALFEQIVMPSRLSPLGLVEVLDWTAAALNRVERGTFFARFEEDHAVQYFYEPFLEAFDPELRQELGVWYTPPEVVRYMVARVDAVLREELGIADGLADPNVYVLDPCCGTGAYLVEVLRRIVRTLKDKGEDALIGLDIKQAMTTRIVGFELLPAPFVVAHLQLGLVLQNMGVTLNDATNERASVYLTNALTGWEPPTGVKRQLGWFELQEERDAAEKVKRDVPILVILGNPPYNGYAGIAIGEERDLSDAYRTTKKVAAPQGQGLNELYVRFFRMAERRIVERTGQGVVCFISNYSWLDGLSHPGMRERYLEAFDRIWIDNLNGDKYKTGKLTPDGASDPSIFSSAWNKEGIQVGTAITTLVRREQHIDATQIEHRHFWGKQKRADLLAESDSWTANYQSVTPLLGLRLSYLPSQSQALYFTWPLLTELFPTSFPGIKTSRDTVVVDIDRDRLLKRMEQYFDPAISHEEMKQIAPGAMESTARFDALTVRDQLRKRGFLRHRIVRYYYRPFDLRWLYWEPETKLLDEKRSEYLPHVVPDTLWIAATKQNRREFDPPAVTSAASSLHIIERGANLFPTYLQPNTKNLSLFDDVQAAATPNLSEVAAIYLNELGATPEDLFYHIVAILHSQSYRIENTGALRQNWPRVPLPTDAKMLQHSAALGREVAALLNPETAVAGIAMGNVRPELREIGKIVRVDGSSLSSEDFAITASWGYSGNGGAVMPGRGRAIERVYTTEELIALDGVPVALELFGATTYDIYLNDAACWRNVPSAIWNYALGGYQVIKKWLSYREHALLGRPLTIEEVREVTIMTRRIAALLLLTPALDASYAACAAVSRFKSARPETL